MRILSLIFLFASIVFAKVITDPTGHKVEVKSIKRIVTSPVVLPALMFAVDNDVNIVGMHPMSKKAWKNSILRKMAPQYKNAETSFMQGGFSLSVEELMKLKPDVVFQVKSQQKSIKQLKGLGVPVMITAGSGLDLPSYFQATLKSLGQLTGKEKRAEFIWNDFDSTTKELVEKTKGIKHKPKAAIFFNVEQLRITGVGSFATFWLGSTGAVNVASGMKTSPRGASVGMEQILQWNPEVIYITNFCETMPEDLYNNRIKGQDWSKINAVKNKRVYKIPLGEYRWYPPSADASLMLKWMAQKNHPKLFNYKMEDEIKKHFKSMYNYNINDTEVKKVLNPSPTGSFY